MRLRYFIAAGLTIVLFSCKKDFVVEDITKSRLTVNAPTDSLVTTTNVITFWWEELNGAESYNLQVVQPSFAKTAKLLVDTNITKNKFNLTLKPGRYQWRVKGVNAGGATVFETFNLIIDSTSDLSDQLVNLLSPSNGLITGSTIVIFKWEGLPAAKKYRIQINGGLIKDTITSLTNYPTTLKAVNNSITVFTWNVKAINDGSESSYNITPFSFTVDLKAPATPGLLAPVHFANANTTDTLKWVKASDAIYDSIYVSEDSLFNNTIHFFSDRSFAPISDLDLVPNAPGNYYWWRIRSFDAVGNRSNFSITRKFRLIP